MAFSHDYLSYDYLKNLIGITSKTIYEDIKAINYYYQGINIYIEYKKGYGFLLVGSDKDKAKLRNHLESIYADVFDIEYNYSSYTVSIIDCLYKHDGIITLKQIADELNLSSRTITKLLLDVRKFLNSYDCKLITKPRYGFVLQGNELHQRLMFAHNRQENFNEKDKGIFENKYQNERLIAIIRDYCKEEAIEINQVGIEKLIAYIDISIHRIRKNNICNLNERQIKLENELFLKLSFEKLINKIEFIYSIVIPYDEQLILCIVFADAFSLSNLIQDNLFNENIKFIYALIINKLKKMGFYKDKDKEKIDKYLYPLVIKTALIFEFDIIDHFYSLFSRKTIKSSVLACNVASRIYECLKEELKINNLCLYWRLCFGIYSYIRSISLTKKINNVAVYTPYEKEYGESLKRRILNRWKGIIKSIEVITIADLRNDNLYKYDYVIYCDCINPLKDKNIPSLKVNYYFINQDVDRFYEEIFIPSHIYHRAFGKISLNDYYLNYQYKGLEEIKEILQQKTSSKAIREQIDNIDINLFTMCNGTLNIVLYCTKKEEAFSKLFFLEKFASENGYRFNRIFIHCIALNQDLFAIRTSEKVMRNVLVIDDTTDVIAKRKIDFYEYYIGNNEKQLK